MSAPSQTEAEACLREVREELRWMLKTFYVGDGQVVCPTALVPHIRSAAERIKTIDRLLGP